MNLFNGMVEVDIPEGFVHNENSIRYPYRKKPEVILSDMEHDTDMTFQRLDKGLTPEQVKPAIQSVVGLLEEKGSIRTVSMRHFFRGKNVDGYWISYISQGIMGDMFHCLAVFSVRNRFTLMTLSTGYDGRKEGKKVFMDALASMKDKSRGIC